jgi:hypothetical protein
VNLGKVYETLSRKQNKHKRNWGTAQVAEGLPSKHETLGSISIAVKKNLKTKNKITV